LGNCFHANAQGGFVPNDGQWHSDVKYRAEIQGGYVYIDRQGLTIQLLENNFYQKLHDWVQGGEDSTGNIHALKCRFVGADLSQIREESKAQSYYNNYYLGNDTEQWADNVKSYGQIRFKDVYQGIDLRFDAINGRIKYEYIVGVGSTAEPILVEIEGADLVLIDDDGALLMQTSAGDYKELQPFAYQLSDSGSILPVPCEYKLLRNRVKYYFPEGYDTTRELIIDPELEFSSYIGSVSNSFGFTASYDSEGHLYAGSIVFGASFPVTAGAYQVNFGGGTIDVGISKFSPDGTQLLYNTFIGGSGNEAPHSIVTDSEGNLFVMGSTSSFNWPLSAGAYQTTFAGGFNTAGAGYIYSNGSDIFVCKLNNTGNQLLASTLLGGSGNDGVSTGTLLDFNYGDRFRGEIVVDEQGNPYIASVTNSANFPIVNGYSSTGTLVLSGVVVKMNASLTNILWSTFIGGSAPESAISLQLAPDNSVYVTGGTTSGNLPVSAGAYQSTYSGGVDGYVAHISADGSTLLNCTYNGTSSFDLNYFVQIDTEGFVYVVGQSLGNYPVSQGVYSNTNGKLFVQKFSADLTTSIWSTVIGSGSNIIDITPSAFLVSDCGQIYISGWGGSVNTAGGSTFGLPVTNDAFQSNTDGSDFYIMVLAVNAADLAYATFFGGNLSSEHVDGGTSRFDKDGTVYQAVCAGCWANSDFPTQQGVWSQTNPSTGCNLAVFKFSLGSVTAQAEVDAPDIVCPGVNINLLNLSVDADIFLWDFGDGTTSTQANPVHSYDAPGLYTIALYASSSEGCLNPDSTFVEIMVGESPTLNVEIPENICAGNTAQLLATGAETWQWDPAAGLSSTTIANPIFSGTETTIYTLTGTTNCGISTITVEVPVAGDNVNVSNGVAICPGQSTQLLANGGASYVWSPVTALNNPNIANPLASPSSTTAYAVTVTTVEGCTVVRSVTIEVLPASPELSGTTSYTSCNGDAVQLTVNGAESYSWSPANGLSSTSVNNPFAYPTITTVYTVTSSNECGSDSLDITVFVNEIDVSVLVDDVVCFDAPFFMEGFGAISYRWEPQNLVASPNASLTAATISENTYFTLYGYDEAGCSAKRRFLVNTYPQVIFRAGNDRVINLGDEVMIESFSLYPITWEFSPLLSCLDCPFPYTKPPETTTFYASVITPDGCIQTDSVRIFVRGNLYVPNAFTPNGDGINDLFQAEGIDIVEFKMEIFSRWGELVFSCDDIEQSWNGGKAGSEYFVPSDVYPYRIVARERYGDVFELKGHVTLIR
jgi:gliding motility-associated-like protein